MPLQYGLDISIVAINYYPSIHQPKETVAVSFLPWSSEILFQVQKILHKFRPSRRSALIQLFVKILHWHLLSVWQKTSHDHLKVKYGNCRNYYTISAELGHDVLYAPWLTIPFRFKITLLYQAKEGEKGVNDIENEESLAIIFSSFDRLL